MDTNPEYKKKALFIDRDGVIVQEDQVDSFEKIKYIPHVFEALRGISRNTDYELVLVSNQDGVGTPSFPFEDFAPVHKRIIDTLNGEGIVFDDENIDYSLPADNCPGRKPGIAMLSKYLDGSYDMEHSFMIGDRLTDMMLAKNLGCKGFLLREPNSKPLSYNGYEDIVVLSTDSWLDILAYFTDDKSLLDRRADIERDTNETKIHCTVNLDGSGKGEISTGIGFLDHMLSQVQRHSRFDLTIDAKGDLDVDEHHTIEDVAITLGEAIKKALGDKRAIERYGFEIVVMDEVAATIALDFSSRPELTWKVDFSREYIGDMPTEMFKHFFRSFASSSLSSLYISIDNPGDNHHMAEAIFKAFGRALRRSVKRIPGATELPSTKGCL